MERHGHMKLEATVREQLVFPRKSRRVGRRGILVSLDGDFGFESMS
jgi:hypothetical protein